MWTERENGTVKIAPVGSVLQRSASAPLPPASFAAMSVGLLL
jgi:hypothetical protein